jgi:hypothetical protein
MAAWMSSMVLLSVPFFSSGVNFSRMASMAATEMVVRGG